MATISTYELTDHPREAQLIVSSDAASTDVVELANLPSFLTHIFLSVRFYDAGGAAVTPTGGTLSVEVQTLGNVPNWEDPPEPTIDATAPTTTDWAANTFGVRVTPTALTGVDHWAAYITMNKT